MVWACYKRPYLKLKHKAMNNLDYMILQARKQKKNPEWIKLMIVKYTKGQEHYGSNLTSMSDEQLDSEILGEELDLWVYNEEKKRRCKI